MAAWRPDFQAGDRGLAERASARIRNGALYSPPRYRNDPEQLPGDGAQAEAGGDRGQELRGPLTRIGVQPVRLLDAQQHPDLMQGEHGQVGHRLGAGGIHA